MTLLSTETILNFNAIVGRQNISASLEIPRNNLATQQKYTIKVYCLSLRNSPQKWNYDEVKSYCIFIRITNQRYMVAFDDRLVAIFHSDGKLKKLWYFIVVYKVVSKQCGFQLSQYLPQYH